MNNQGNAALNLVMIKRETFDTLDDEKLGRECMEPTFMLIRGQSPEVKTAVLSQLSQGQHALCMFRVMYDHSHKSAPEYYGWISYMLGIPGYWDRVIEGIRFFDETGILPLLEDTREYLEVRNRELGAVWDEAVLTDLDRDPELKQAIHGLYQRFLQIAPVTLSVIADYIRTHPEEYVEFTD